MKQLHKTNLTPDQRQARYTELHPNYDHTQTDFTAFGKQPITVTCKIHGPFETNPKLHLYQVHTCPTCCKEFKPIQPPKWRKYQKKQFTEMIPYTSGFNLTGVSISDFDKQNGSPKPGDFIARGANPTDMWLIAAQYHRDNYIVVKEK